MLRSFGSATLAAGVLGIAVSGAWSYGCSITKPTELVPGALTQVEVPKSLAGIKVSVYTNGQRVFNTAYDVTNGSVRLPATLGVVSGGAKTDVIILIGGFDAQGVAGSEFHDPTKDINDVDAVDAKGNLVGPRVRRGSQQSYVDQHTLFLPLPLSYSCWDTSCTNDKTGQLGSDTCKAAQCLPGKPNAALVDFDPSLVDGTQDCFSPSTCFTPAVTAVTIDATKCIYDVPPGETGGSGLNVRVLYQDMQQVKNPATGTWEQQTLPTSEQEVLNVEPYDPAGTSPVEGYAVPDPAKPTRFQLAKGLCNLVQNVTTPPTPPTTGTTSAPYHTISAVQVSTTCPSKPPLLPVCAAEQSQATLQADGGPTNNVVCNQPITLVQAPSVLYMVMDDSQIMSGAFGPEGYATAMGLSLGNPLFKRTYVAFRFLTHDGNDCSSGSTPYASLGDAGIDFGLATKVQPQIASAIGAVKPPDGPLITGDASTPIPPNGFAPFFIEGAMRPDQGAYKHVADFIAGLNETVGSAAVMFFVNRAPDSRRPVLADGGVVADGGLVDPTFADAGIPWGLDCYPAVDSDAGTSAKTSLEQEITTAAKSSGINSYFVVLNNGVPTLNATTGTPLKYFQAIQSDLKAQGVTSMAVLDATEPKTQAGTVLSNFAQTATTLGTCVYELPPGIDTTAKLTMTIPVPIPQTGGRAPAPLAIPFDSTCTAATQDSSNGWNIDGSHLRVCGTGAQQQCWTIRAAVEAVTAATLQSTPDGGTASFPEVPLTVQMPCTDGGT